MEKKYPVKIVSKRVGMSPNRIRAWEVRYKAVVPGRSETNRRLYSDEDIEKLIFLKRAVEGGEPISNIAHLSIDELQKLVKERNLPEAGIGIPGANDPIIYHFKKCLKDIEELNASKLESHLLNASMALGQQQFLEKIVQPLLEFTGELWSNGELKIVHEHMASSIIRSLLGTMMISSPMSADGPIFLVTTPPRQLHELGAMMTAVTAMSLGWRSIYLGPNLPMEDIARAALQYKAKVVALSIIYPLDDSRLKLDLQRLEILLKNQATIIIGGQGASAYSMSLELTGIKIIDDLNHLRAFLKAENVPKTFVEDE